jgi:hypothetical protein
MPGNPRRSSHHHHTAQISSLTKEDIHKENISPTSLLVNFKEKHQEDKSRRKGL